MSPLFYLSTGSERTQNISPSSVPSASSRMASHEMAAVSREMDAVLKESLDNGILDEQFLQLKELQDDTPDFLTEMTDLYFQDSAGKIDQLKAMVNAEPVDFVAIDALVHQFKGSSASFGASKMVLNCIHLREACQNQSVERCRLLHEQLKAAFEEVKQVLTRFLHLEARYKEIAAQQQKP